MFRVCAALVTVMVATGSLPAVAHAEPLGPLYVLVDTAAQRLATAEAVAATKWLNGGAITDPTRANQVLDTVGADAAAHGIEPAYVRGVFQNQIDANEGIQYTRFGQWSFDPTLAPASAPDLSESRAAIDGYNKMMVNEIALHWNTLHAPTCPDELQATTAAVMDTRQLDPLYRQALMSATRALCA